MTGIGPARGGTGAAADDRTTREIVDALEARIFGGIPRARQLVGNR